MKNFLIAFFVIILFLGFYLINYTAFSSCLSDDVEFNFGKHRMRNRRKKTKGFWKKFFFLDIKNEVKKWHYICFWVNFIAFIMILISMVFFFVIHKAIGHILFCVSIDIFMFTEMLAAFSYWRLYAGNKVRSRKKYRKNNRK